ncbi:kelch-like protein 11 [Acanthaster planci]|uniref:Kelch-like protein 11 n=1 Tax=Acanthaster planci TaxID=133434 RepID=A0A8B7YIP2_ACAPL|nr:kelch-like protein 11 [Acanthaster planci]XP_022092471.1 kelch-like protein 11 [Acanthaster planci]XP_022092472.1 kelch-like protein 11 [Acanthaster planci]
MSSETEMEVQDVTIDPPKDNEDNEPSKKTCRKLGALSHYIEKFMNQTELSDVVLCFDGKQYRAHRLILGAWSSKLEEKMAKAPRLGGAGAETGQPFLLDLDEDVVGGSSSEDSDAAFQQFLRFLYSGKADLTSATVKVVLNLAQVYGIQALQEICEQFISKEVGQHNIDGALEWLREAEEKNLTFLRESCLKVLRAYVQYIPDSAWQAQRLDQLMSVIESSDVVIEDEYALFLKIETWIRSEQVTDDNLWDSLEKILPQIRFSNMTIWQLQQFGKSRLGVQISQKYPEIVTEALRVRALASEEVDFTEVSECGFVPPRFYLKFVPPGGKLSSIKEAKKDIFTRARVNHLSSNYSDRRAQTWRRRQQKGGLYRQADNEAWEVSIMCRQESPGGNWRVQALFIPRWEHVSEKYRIVWCVKSREDTPNPIIINHSGTVDKGAKRASADGIYLFAPYVWEEKPEYVYSREVVYVG